MMSVSDERASERAGEENKNEERERGREIELPPAEVADSRNELPSFFFFVCFPSPFHGAHASKSWDCRLHTNAVVRYGS